MYSRHPKKLPFPYGNGMGGCTASISLYIDGVRKEFETQALAVEHFVHTFYVSNHWALLIMCFLLYYFCNIITLPCIV